MKKIPFVLPACEEDILKGKQSIRSQALGNQNSDIEILLDGDDDTLSSLEEKELENLTGTVTHPSHVCCTLPPFLFLPTCVSHIPASAGF